LADWQVFVAIAGSKSNQRRRTDWQQYEVERKEDVDEEVHRRWEEMKNEGVAEPDEHVSLKFRNKVCVISFQTFEKSKTDEC
jgi:hypothetical protein